MSAYFNDPDPAETNNWRQSLDGVIAHEGAEKAVTCCRTLTDHVKRRPPCGQYCLFRHYHRHRMET